MCQGSLVNGSLGKVIEFIGVHDAQQRHIAIADIGRKEDDVSHVVNAPDAGENEAGLIALDGPVFTKNQPWPLVQFTNGKALLCSPIEFIVEGLKGNVEARRLQIPLGLSWAMSIHKSQGQTLSRVKVDLARAFEKGQGRAWFLPCVFNVVAHVACAHSVYVAISRATGMEGLEIVNFDRNK